MLGELKFRVFDTGLPKTAQEVIQKYLEPLFKYAPKGVVLKESDAPPKKGEPILGFCASGGTEAEFLKHALKNPSSPAVILTHSKANSLPAGCEISARLRAEHKRGKRAPVTLLQVDNKERVDSVLRAAAVASKFVNKPPKMGIVGDPSNWLISAGYFAKNMPAKFGIKTEKVKMSEFITRAQKSNVYDALRGIIADHNLDAFTVRCFDLLGTLKCTSCLEVSRLNDEGITAACEGDIPATVTMMVMQAMTGLPVFMANPAGVNEEGKFMFAHCTIPRKLCTESEIKTHYESGIGCAVAGKVKEGVWTVARFGHDGELMADTVEVANPKERSLSQCRTQIVAKVSHEFAERVRTGNVLGNHFMFVPGDIRSALETYSSTFLKWK